MSVISLAIKGIVKNKLRSFLTMLGVIIGVTSVILLMNIIGGYQEALLESYESMGVSVIEVNTYFDVDALSVSELESFAVSHSDLISGYSPAINIYDQEVKYNDTHYASSIRGVGVDYESIRQLTVDEGEFLNYIDIEYNRAVCVIGSYVQFRLFGEKNSIGEYITINGHTYQVVGVLEETEDSEMGSADDLIYIPYTSAQILSKSNKINNVLFLAADKSYITEATDSIEEFMFERIGDVERYSVYCLSSLVTSMNDMVSRISMLLFCVAAISLIVGGIGIMNIMFVSVVERTNEIGIRTAIGAKPRTIMGQFLIEAITTSTLGGLIGIALGCSLTYVIARVIDIPFLLSGSAIRISVVVSVAVGGLFGYLPARRAARMDAVEALTD